MHRHRNEDECTFLLSGGIGAVLGDEEVLSGPGDLMSKPGDQWHTFWNASDEPAAVVELMAAQYGCELDFDATGPILARHGLRF